MQEGGFDQRRLSSYFAKQNSSRCTGPANLEDDPRQCAYTQSIYTFNDSGSKASRSHRKPCKLVRIEQLGCNKRVNDRIHAGLLKVFELGTGLSPSHTIYRYKKTGESATPRRHFLEGGPEKESYKKKSP